MANTESTVQIELAMPNANAKEPQSLFAQAYDMITSPVSFTAEAHEDEAPIAFTYSLYYVYYDQYTYIRGILYQNIIIALGAIVVCA